MERPEVITFDCYGTLIDWEAGIVSAFEGAAAAAGARVDRADLLARYVAVEHALQAGAYRSYRDVLAETARRICASLGFAPTEGGAFLPESVASWPAFPDTNRALARLAAAGIRLGVLSNIDDDLFDSTRAHLDAPIEFVVTAAQVGAYKPARAHFDAGRARVAGRRWLHAAQSHFHDVTPAVGLGIPIAWVNRSRGPARLGTDGGAAVRPDLEVHDLTSLADTLLVPREPA